MLTTCALSAIGGSKAMVGSGGGSSWVLTVVYIGGPEPTWLLALKLRTYSELGSGKTEKLESPWMIQTATI